MRRLFVAGNWKMNTLGTEAEALAHSLARSLADYNDMDLAVFPPFPYLTRVYRALFGSPVVVGAQNVYPAAKGAYTGEVSPLMLLDSGCRWVLVGHSERRHILGERDDFLRRKVLESLRAGLRVLFCVGETLAERQADRTTDVLRRQLDACLTELTAAQWDELAIAYEPVWAIGTGHNATPEQAQQMHAFVRQWVEHHAGQQVAASCRILYGGSVRADNALSLVQQPDVDGLLVGGASLQANEFTQIVQAARRAKT
ncbi:MAG: triose-phosphate isomerase [Gemmataceae bacterium]